jgi:TatD DNase family protein
MGLIDSHAHLTMPELCDQLQAILDRAREAGVERVISVGVNLEDSRAVLRLCEAHPELIQAVIGFHPHEAAKVTDAQIAALTELLDHPAVVGFGEIGLDYHYDFSPRDVQRQVFAKQLAVAADHPLPLVIHSREAFDDTARLLIEHGFEQRPVVFHCFTGTADQVQHAARHGWRISFTGVVTFAKSQWLQRIARTYPLEHLMLETDSPYLSPEPVRSQRPNEPALVAHIARFLAELRGLAYEDFVERTSENTGGFYRRAGSSP